MSIIIKIFLILIVVSSVASVILFSNNSEKQEKSELDATISPAKDLSGKWKGSGTFTESVPGADCIFTGDFELNLQQNRNNVQGDLVFTETSFKQNQKQDSSSIPPIGCAGPVTGITTEQITGIVSSSSINLRVNDIEQLFGSFTSSVMSLGLKSCLVQFGDECSIEEPEKWEINLLKQ